MRIATTLFPNSPGIGTYVVVYCTCHLRILKRFGFCCLEEAGYPDRSSRTVSLAPKGGKRGAGNFAGRRGLQIEWVRFAALRSRDQGHDVGLIAHPGVRRPDFRWSRQCKEYGFHLLFVFSVFVYQNENYCGPLTPYYPSVIS